MNNPPLTRKEAIERLWEVYNQIPKLPENRSVKRYLGQIIALMHDHRLSSAEIALERAEAELERVKLEGEWSF